MMNGEGPSVPITTLAGIQSLTDLLLELPLPTPLPGSTGHQSLLSHLRESEEARQILSTQDSILIPPLIEALSCTTTDHIEVKDGYYGSAPHGGQLSQLVQFLVNRNPSLFKGVVHTSSPVTTEHHSATSPWLQRQCSSTSLHPQQPTYSSTSVSPCSTHQTQGSPSYFPVDPTQTSRHVGPNKSANISQHKAQLNLYSQFTPSTAPTGQQTSVHQNAILQGSEQNVSSNIQESQQMFNSVVEVANISQISAVNSFSNGTDSTIASPSKPNRTENHVDDNQQAAGSGLSSVNVSPEKNVSSPTQSSNIISTTSPHVHLSSVIMSPSVQLVDIAKKHTAEQQISSSPSANEEKKSGRSHVKTLVNKSQECTKNKSASEICISVCKTNNSRGNGNNSSKGSISKNIIDLATGKENKEQKNSRSAAVTRRKSVTEPVVILSKLSLEDQVLAQKSVKQFTLKNNKTDCSSDENQKSVKNKKFFSSSRDLRKRRSSAQEDIGSLGKSSPRKKSKNSECFPNPKVSGYNKAQKRHHDESKEQNCTPSKTNRSSLGERVKKRRRSSLQTSYIESPTSDASDSDESFHDAASPPPPPTISMKAKKQKHKRVKKEPLGEPLSADDLMDTNTYQQFSRTVDAIFDAMEDIDFSAEIDEDAECPAEALIPLAQLHDLCNESAKLKMLQAMNQFPPERLVRLLSILERNVLDGSKLSPMHNMDEQDEDEAKLWIELTMERVMRSADASLTSLFIMTSPNMPEKVFLEDVIERIVLFLKFQMQNTVFPVFDPAYRIDRKSKDGYVANIKQKRAHAHKVKEKSLIQIYNKLHEAVGLLAELLEVQTLTDTIILQVSTLGVSPFFVEGISELQLSALRLVTSVFARYDKHRQLILEDILASIARLPTSKRSLRNYRLNSEENIQMLTALVLQLIHSVVRLPEVENEIKPTINLHGNDKKPENAKESPGVDKDVLIVTSYEASVRTAINFLSVFLKKCGTKNEEMDYRPLFENFVQDLLSTVNKPEWPASELLLSLLGRLLVQNFSNKSSDMSLRVASLDYLGVVAARLRKDAVTSRLRKEIIDDIIKQITAESSDSFDIIIQSKSKKNKNKIKPSKKDDVQILQKALLQYLDANVHSDPALQFARRFYVAQWYRDAAAGIKSGKSPEKDKEKDKIKIEQARSGSRNKSKSLRSRRRSSQINYEEEEEEEEEEIEKEEEKIDAEADDKNSKILALAEERKQFLLTVVQPECIKNLNMKEENHIDYTTGELISRYLASSRPFSQSFDIYLSQILRVLNETAVAVRTKAMKCLTLVVEADPGILARPDMQRGVHGRLLDQSTSVREAAVDLVGKFILIRPELTSQYYEMLTDRILDTGVSVRKRVIKILKDVCLEQPDFLKIPEICVKIIRRVNDEDGIKKLVGEVFQSMWFTPASNKEPERILQKVKNITHVVAACKDIGLEWFEQLLTNLLKNKDDSNYKAVLKSCRQIVDCLVENVLQLEESSQNTEGNGASQNLVACLTTLYLFSKIYPPFVVPHATTIQPYLSMRCNTQADYHVLQNVARTLELVIPLMEHPSESFLAQIEEDMVKLILRHGMMILPSCVSCLGAVVNRVTKNYQLVRDCFHKFFVVLLGFKKEHEKNPENPLLSQQRPKLLRSLFTVGLFCRHFDFDSLEVGNETANQEPLKDRVFDALIYFNKHEDEDIRFKSLNGLGFAMIRHYEFMLGPEVKTLYQYLLSNPGAPTNLKCQVLKNLTNYLIEEEARMIQQDAEWSKVSKSEDLKEMGDVTSGMASTVVQVYLKQILESVLHCQMSVRKVALHVIQLILGQGLVHPVQIVPYLVCLGSDDDQVIRTKADQLLQEIEKKYPGFIQMKSLLGVRMSFKMQQLIHNNSEEIIRGVRIADSPTSRNGFLYSVIRGTRQNRRAFLLSMLKLFDDQAKTPLTELLYIADNVVYFPYQAQDEPLFVIHQIDVMLSVSGSNLLQSFREGLVSLNGEVKNCSEENTEYDDDDDDDDVERIYGRLPEDTCTLQECMTASQGCVLLLFIKQTLKEMYGLTDNKIQQYSPNEAAKVYEKSLNRRGHVRFKPLSVIDFMKTEDYENPLDENGKKCLIQQYLNFKQLMLTIDPADDDDEEETSKPTVSTPQKTKSAAEDQPSGDTNVNPAVNVPNVRHTPEKVKMTPKNKSPSRSHRQKSPRSTKEKVKKKHKRKRRRIVDSDASDNSGSDPDYMDSS